MQTSSQKLRQLFILLISIIFFIHNIYMNKMQTSNNFSDLGMQNQFIQGRRYGVMGLSQGQAPCRTGNRSGHWSERQNSKYYAFLKRFHQKFDEKQSRRYWKVFKILAKFIKTRNADQCRSHHHKMKKNFGCIQETLEFLRQKQPGIEQMSQKYQRQLENMDYTANESKIQDQRVRSDKCFVSHGPWQEMDYNQYHHNKVYRNQENLGMLKKNDIAFQKTGDEYPEFMALQHPDFNLYNEFQMPFDPLENLGKPLQGFPTTGILDEPEKQFGGSNRNIYQMGREAKIFECHYYYLKWVESMNSLLAQDSHRLDVF